MTRKTSTTGIPVRSSPFEKRTLAHVKCYPNGVPLWGRQPSRELFSQNGFNLHRVLNHHYWQWPLGYRRFGLCLLEGNFGLQARIRFFQFESPFLNLGFQVRL